MLSCMPFLSPILINKSNSVKESMGVMIPFSLGRIFTYVIIAIIASSSSVLVKQIINDNTIVNYILGISTIFLGSFMLYNSLKNNKSCGILKYKTDTKKDISTFGYFSLGATISINLCTPIVSLIALSSNTTNIYSAVGLGLSFGIGASFFTLFFYGFFFSTLIRGILEQFKNYKKAVEISASLLLILVGILIISGNLSL